MLNLQETITLLQLQGGAKLVRVRFSDNDSATYTYKCMTVTDPMEGDLVVVESSRGNALATVTEVMGGGAVSSVVYDKLKHIIARVDMVPFRDLLTQEDRVRERLAMAEVSERLNSVRRYVDDKELGQLQQTMIGAAGQTYTRDVFKTMADQIMERVSGVADTIEGAAQ